MSDSLSIIQDIKTITLSVSGALNIPVSSIVGLGSPIQGGIGYNIADNKIYYANGFNWLPISIGGGGGSGNSSSFSLIKSSNQTILPSIPTVLTFWSTTPQPPYHDLTGNWNLATGVFTATVICTLTINACITWSAGISNLGNRTVNIFYKPSAGIATIVKQTMRQANPDTNVETAQETTATILMNIGDSCWVGVMHNAATNLIISNSISTTLSGILITV